MNSGKRPQITLWSHCCSLTQLAVASGHLLASLFESLPTAEIHTQQFPAQLRHQEGKRGLKKIIISH